MSYSKNNNQLKGVVQNQKKAEHLKECYNCLYPEFKIKEKKKVKKTIFEETNLKKKNKNKNNKNKN